MDSKQKIQENKKRNLQTKIRRLGRVSVWQLMEKAKTTVTGVASEMKIRQ